MGRKVGGEGHDKRILVIDVGGSHVKFLVTGMKEHRKIPSGPRMTPSEMIRAVKKGLTGRGYDVVSIGYPAPVVHGRPVRDPVNLGQGWVGYDFRKAFGRPVRILNDAAMQALGSYAGGRMLFLGLGTGLGTAMIVDSKLEAMELGHLPYKKHRTYEDYVGERGLKRMGLKKWEREVRRVVKDLREALEPDYVVLGGGNERLLKRLPPGCRRGDNDNAFRGGVMMWEPPRPPAGTRSPPAP